MSEKTTLGLKCPSCGGTVSYDPESQEIICSSCDSSFPINKFIELSREKQKTEAVSWDRISGYVPESQEIHLYTCSSCGAQVMTEGLNVTGTCPYCGSDFVLDDRFEKSEYKSLFPKEWSNLERTGLGSLEERLGRFWSEDV